MDAIGIRITFKKDRMPELRKMARQGKIPMRTDGWNADYPDAENYMQLLYGPNAKAGQENHAHFGLPEFDKLYDAGAPPARFAGAHEALRPDDRARPRVCAVAAAGAPDRGPARAAVDPATTSRTRSARKSGGTSTSIRRCVPK